VRLWCKAAYIGFWRSLKTPAIYAENDASVFILINAEEVVDAVKKGLIMRASLL
jgi:hypothetical protein